MPRMIGTGLSRREREILDVLHRRGKGTVAEVQAELPDAPTYSTVRTLLRILEEKGHVEHREDGRRFVYSASESRQLAAGQALKRVIQTFFSGSLQQAVTSFLSDSDSEISDDDLRKLAASIENARSQE